MTPFSKENKISSFFNRIYKKVKGKKDKCEPCNCKHCIIHKEHDCILEVDDENTKIDIIESYASRT